MSNVLHILSQHSPACKPRPSPDVQWPTSLHLVWTLRYMHEPVAFRQQMIYAEIQFYLMAGPVDRIVQSVPLRCKVVTQLWVCPLFLRVGSVQNLFGFQVDCQPTPCTKGAVKS